MISFLRGILLEKLPDALILDVGGVGYEVRVTPRLWQQARTDAETQLYTHFQVREDAQTLYGFADLQERDLFRTLLTVSGVGPKTAMAVLSVATPDQIIRAVQDEDVAALKAPGVGPKIVKRLISELKPAFGNLPTKGQLTISRGSAHHDIIAALVSLGYTEIEVRTVINEIDLAGLPVDQAIKKILQTFSK